MFAEYTHAYGNQKGNYTFCCLRFKKPILHVRSASLPVLDTVDRVILYHCTTFVTEWDQPKQLVLVTHPAAPEPFIPVPPDANEAQLLSVLLTRHFPNDILFSVAHRWKLYVIGTNRLNDLPYTKLKRDRAFLALYHIWDRTPTASSTLPFCSSCRYFHAKDENKWSSWRPVVLRLLNLYTLQQGRILANIYRKSLVLPDALKLDDFYVCEVLLVDDELLGVMFKGSPIKYVSPMIVSEKAFLTSPMNDVNRVECDHWIPLYQNQTMWIDRGIFWYARDFEKNREFLCAVSAYLKKQTSEKYQCILKDISLIMEALF